MIFFIFFSLKTVLANWESIKIISRSEWWANENFRYLDSKIWQEKIQKWKNSPKKKLTEKQKEIAKIQAEKIKKANIFLRKNFWDLIKVTKIIKEQNWHKLVWPIAKVKKRYWIVIHHTDSDYWTWTSSFEAIRKIYKYHAITRWWWDIWYNYLIWYNWEIFEWRASWDDTVWAHDKWNNQWNIWISIIWNYDKKWINKAQYESLKKLIKYLVKKYNIDLNTKVPYFKWCVWVSKKCINHPLIVSYHYPIVWHRDAGHTACPWEKLYAQLQQLKKELWVWKNDKNKVLLEKLRKYFNSLKEDKLLNILAKVEIALDKNNIDFKKKAILFEIKNIILNIENKKNDILHNNKNIKNNSFDDNNKIKVKLSYPDNLDYINFKISWRYWLKLRKKLNTVNLIFYNKQVKKRNINIKFQLIWHSLVLQNWQKIIDFNKKQFLRISIPKWAFLEISSWNRKPTWDKTWKYNDNKFKWDIILYLKNNKLVVVNELSITDYLKWVAEVSNSTPIEKIKAIIVLARTYARWYITKAKKFEKEFYDASDNPNIFQKYLWYSYELRSPNVAKVVEQTKDYVITYNWQLIKPWYFSSSNWKTTSFIDYCKKAKGVKDCAHPENFPFLVSVLDPGWIWKEKLWHSVWVPGTGISYFAKRWWNFSMILKYFLKWIEIKYLP